MDKEQNRKFKEQMKKRAKELPQILQLLNEQKKLIECLKLFDDNTLANIPLHDIIQNLTIKATELTSRFMIQPCYDWNCYALSRLKNDKQKHWLLCIFSKQYRRKKNILKKQDKRLKKLLKAEEGDEVIHSFTEIIDNLQRIVPEKTHEMLLTLEQLNLKSIADVENAINNYKRLTLD